MVVYGFEWHIVSGADYMKAMAKLDDDEFIAEMSDSYERTRAEKAEIERQREDVIAQAKEKGLI